MFFQGSDPVHRTMNSVASDLEAAGIAYAIMGAMAVNAHGHHRTTDDVDILVTPEGFVEFCRRYVPGRYERMPGRPRRFIDPVNGATFDLLLTGLYPGRGDPGPIAFPQPGEVAQTIDGRQVVNLHTLIQLKLAARRYGDFDDVVKLIGVHSLDESFQQQLHPSLHRDYIECLEEKRREDEYEARQDRMVEQKLREKGLDLGTDQPSP
jgi:hypothetical protein